MPSIEKMLERFSREYSWESEKFFTKEELVEYFCNRIRPKLSELDEFRNQDLSSSELQREALIRLLKWPDDGTEYVSKEFREFYDGLSFYRNVRDSVPNRNFGQLFDIIFEIHGPDPRKLAEAIKNGIRFLSDVRSGPKSFHKHWVGCSLRVVLDAGLRQGSHAAFTLQAYLEHYKKEWNKAEWGPSARCNPFAMLERDEIWSDLPCYAGFRVCCDNALESCCEDIKKFLERDMAVTSELPAADPETSGYIQVLVGPSGCGKTSKIHSLLREHWGLYLLPGNLPKESDEVQLRNRLKYKPRRGGGSRDTQTWLDDVKSKDGLGLARLNAGQDGPHKVLHTRIWILDQFRAIGPNRTPGDWLKLQTDCKEPQNDVFNHLYRVVRLSHANLTARADAVRSSKLFFCFDEAQCDLEANLPSERMRWEFQPLGSMINAAFMVKQVYGNRKNLGICVSGTALQLREIQRIIDREAYLIRKFEKYARIIIPTSFTASDLAPQIKHDFQLVEEEDDFRDLIRARGYRFDDEGLIDTIIQYSKPLRGRIVWSVCYLDDIKEFIKSQDGDERKVLDKHVKEISEKVYEMAKDGLIERLKDMRRHRAVGQQRLQEELVDELCSLAIRSDLLGEATIFKSSESVELVALGFAFLEEPHGSAASPVKFKERLAVDAAIKHFQSQKLSNGQSEYDRALINFLYDQQSSASALGKVAELFFAWHLRKVLGTRADVILPVFGDDYRTQVTRFLIGKAHTVEHLETGNRRPGVENQFANHAKCEDLTEFRLVEGRRTAYQEEFEEKRTITMWEWLRNIRMGSQEDDLQSTFWFPSNNTGPDVLFALRRKTPKATISLPHHYRRRQHAGEKRKRDLVDERELDYSLVLCAVQIKREKRISDVGRAIATTDPNYWFSHNYPHHTRDALEITKELREWRKGRYPIVRILVSTLTDPSQYRKAEEGSTTAEKYFRNKAAKTNQKSSEDILVEEGRRDDLQNVRIPSHQQYFTSIGAEHDDLLFGDAFRRLRKAQGIQTTRERMGEV